MTRPTKAQQRSAILAEALHRARVIATHNELASLAPIGCKHIQAYCSGVVSDQEDRIDSLERDLAACEAREED